MSVIVACNNNTNELGLEGNTGNINTIDSIEFVYGNIRIEADDIDPLLLLDDSLIYATSISHGMGMSSQITYNRHYFYDGRTVEIGTVESFITGGGQSFVKDNAFYKLITTAESQDAAIGSHEFEHLLIEICLEENTLNTHIFNPGGTRYLWGQEIRLYQDNLLLSSTHGEAGGDTWTYYLKIFDLNSNEVLNESEKFILNRDPEIGFSISTIDVYGDYIYVLVIESLSGDFELPDGRINTENYVPILKVYNKDLEKVREIDLGGIPDAFELVRSWGIRRWGDYIFINNRTVENLLGVIVDGRIEPILIEVDFRMVDSFTANSSTPMFFIDRTNSVFTIDKESGELNKHELYFEENYSIRHIMQNGYNLFVIMGHDAGPDATFDEFKEDLFYHIHISDVIG